MTACLHEDCNCACIKVRHKSLAKFHLVLFLKPLCFLFIQCCLKGIVVVGHVAFGAFGEIATLT